MRVWDGRTFCVEPGREPCVRTVYLCDYLPMIFIVAGILSLGCLAAMGR
jgi:hypothetical protein